MTVSRTRAASARAMRFWSGRAGVCSTWLRSCWISAMHRGVSRELRVAQLQSDFVSAVSHEFRSPLTSLRGITELLTNDRIADEGRKRQSYAFLERESGRLQHQKRIAL